MLIWLRSRKGIVVILQWLLVAVVVVLGLTTGAWRESPTVFWSLVTLTALGNAAMMRMPLLYFYQPTVGMNLFIADTVFVGAAIYSMRGFDTELYLPYFLIVLVAALTRSLARALAIAVAVSVLYMFLVWREGSAGSLLDSAYLIRLPFFLVIALFTGYLANAARLQSEAVQSSRILSEQVRSLQQLASGIAHEVRNPLTAIGTGLEVLLRRLPQSGEERVIVQEALAQVGRVRRMVQETLDLARPLNLKAGWLDLNAALERTVRDEAGSRADGRVAIVRRIAPQPLMLWGDSVLIEQAMHNVVRNALEAMPQGGTLEVGTSALSVRGQEQVLARISDTGGGIPVHQLERLFQPFYTTKPQGTGLGLSLARKYLHAHGGELTVDSVTGVGTRVALILPVAGPVPEMSSAKAPAGS